MVIGLLYQGGEGILRLTTVFAEHTACTEKKKKHADYAERVDSHGSFDGFWADNWIEKVRQKRREAVLRKYMKA